MTAVQSDMSPGEEGTTINNSDQGTAETASGVIWWGPPLDAPADWDPQWKSSLHLARLQRL